jgi:hypothetical protein
MSDALIRNLGLDQLFTFANLALTAAATTVNNQNALHALVDGRFATKASGASAVANVKQGAFATIADGNTFYMNLLLGSDMVWLLHQGEAGKGVPDPNDLHTALSGAITAINTANPVQITSSAHNLRTGDEVQIEGLPGLTINGGRYKVTRVSASAFTLDGVNGATIGTYVSGGVFRSCRLARVMVGVIKVVLSGSAGFTPGTSNWDAAGVTATVQHWGVAPVGESV